MSRLTRPVRLLGAFFLLGLAACGPEPTTQVITNPTTTSVPTTGPTPPALTVSRPTLPPSWTPTLTFTPAPTMTHLPTITPRPTLSLDQICGSLQLLSPLPDGLYVPWDGNITVAFDVGTGAVGRYILTPMPTVGSETPTLSADDLIQVTVRFLARHRLSGKNLGFMAPGGQGVVVTVAASRLPQPGLYDWTLTVYSDAFGSPCPGLSGYFIVGQPEWVTPQATPEATVEATAGVGGR
jgi:hypothetical protein